MRPLRLAAGVAVLAAGLILVPAPGPGLLVVAVGAALLAGESASVATWLDHGELRVRRWLGRGPNPDS
nr:PGPGW domain-containing protein [Solimonas terrae]